MAESVWGDVFFDVRQFGRLPVAPFGHHLPPLGFAFCDLLVYTKYHPRCIFHALLARGNRAIQTKGFIRRRMGGYGDEALNNEPKRDGIQQSVCVRRQLVITQRKRSRNI